MRTAAATLLLGLIVACGTTPPADGAPRRLPNIVVLYADDLGYGDLACFNAQSRIPTPNLDQLAREGLRCLDAHSSSGICSPSRYALLTGRHHWRKFHGIVNAFGPSVIAPERLTMAAMLRSRGYATACIGKWHLGWDWDAIRRPGVEMEKNGRERFWAASAFDWSAPIPDGPLAHGFDHYFGDDVPNFPPYAWIEDDHVVGTPTVKHRPDPLPTEGSPECRPGPAVEGWRLDAVMPELTRRATAWLRARQGRDEPFFLYFPFTSPHAPIVPTAEFSGASKAGPYGDYVAQTDATVGAVLQTLDELGMTENTIVVFTSDNGPEAYAYERTRRFDHKSMGDLRGVKRDVFEGGHRVPMIVRWPGVLAPGTVTPELIGQVDLMATFAAITGFELPDDAAEDSFDLLPLWRGEVDSVRTFLVHNTNAKVWAIRHGDWLYLDAKDGHHNRIPAWYREAAGWEQNPHPHALYDLRVDPEQRHNVCTEHPEVVTHLQALLQQLREQGHSAPRLAGG
ncbi:MAG: sulfatase-like hydrolase/transferase [Planctomycetes bacterium]|nr:sulfatase-like hydrolase/transferase [Planctomycetota bacterium]